MSNDDIRKMTPLFFSLHKIENERKRENDSRRKMNRPVRADLLVHTNLFEICSEKNQWYAGCA
jgi:hypothetical protein